MNLKQGIININTQNEIKIEYLFQFLEKIIL